jgi:cell division protein FtsL
MIMDLEEQIRALQKELADLQREIAALSLQPCKGDSEIARKDAKFDELNRRATIIRRTIWDLSRKRQLLISQSNKEASCDSPDSSDSS